MSTTDFDAAGIPLITGRFRGSLSMGGTTVSNLTGNNYDLFAAKLDDVSGWLSFLDSLGDGYVSVYAQRWNANGEFLARGAFYGDLSLNGTTISNPMVGGWYSDRFVAKLSGSSSWLSHLDISDGYLSLDFEQWDADGNLSDGPVRRKPEPQRHHDLQSAYGGLAL